MKHTRTLEHYQEAFDRFIAKKDWRAAQSVIDDMFKDGFEHYSTVLRRVYLRAQFETAEELDGELTYVPYEHDAAPELEIGWQEEAPKQFPHNPAMEEWNEKHLDNRAGV